MQKYLGFIKFKFLAALQFRSEVFVWLFLDFIPYFSLFFIFYATFQGHDTIRGLTLVETLEYFFFVSIIQSITGVHFESWRVEEIRLGKIDFFLIRPFSYLKDIVLSDLAGKLLYLLLFIPIYVLFFFTVQLLFNIHLFTHITAPTLMIFLIFMVVGYFFQLCVALMIVFFSFWFESAEGLQHFKWVMLTIFSGGLVPTEFMPVWMQHIITILPFRYLIAFPIQIIQGKATVSLIDISIVSMSVVLSWTCVLMLQKYGIAKYSSAGG